MSTLGDINAASIMDQNWNNMNDLALTLAGGLNSASITIGTVTTVINSGDPVTPGKLFVIGQYSSNSEIENNSLATPSQARNRMVQTMSRKTDGG